MKRRTMKKRASALRLRMFRDLRRIRDWHLRCTAYAITTQLVCERGLGGGDAALGAIAEMRLLFPDDPRTQWLDRVSRRWAS